MKWTPALKCLEFDTFFIGQVSKADDESLLSLAKLIFFLLLSFRIWKLFWEFSLISGSIIGSVKHEGCEGTPVSTKILSDCIGQMLKAPPLKSSGLHISVLKCNCWIYHANIGLRLIYPSFAFTTGLLKCQNQLQ